MRKTYQDPNSTVTDNYLMTCDKWRLLFLEMDHEELARRFSLEQDCDALYITYYHEKYRLDRSSGMITLLNAPERILPFNTIMSIYNLFYYSKPFAKIKGEFVPFRLVKRASPFEDAFKRTVLKPLALTFTGKIPQLDQACRALGGTPIPQGDVGYVIPAFAWMPVSIVFWDADDEFEAHANLLFDADITDFIHEETVCCIAADMIRRLSEEAGLGEVPELLGGNL